MRSEADRFKELYDVEKHVMAVDGGVLVEDPYPAIAELRAQAPVHEGSVRELDEEGMDDDTLRIGFSETDTDQNGRINIDEFRDWWLSE